LSGSALVVLSVPTEYFVLSGGRGLCSYQLFLCIYIQQSLGKKFVNVRWLELWTTLTLPISLISLYKLSLSNRTARYWKCATIRNYILGIPLL